LVAESTREDLAAITSADASPRDAHTFVAQTARALHAAIAPVHAGRADARWTARATVQRMTAWLAQRTATDPDVTPALTLAHWVLAQLDDD